MPNTNSLLTRRSLLKSVAFSAACVATSNFLTSARAEEESSPPTEEEVAVLNQIGRDFIARFKSPGLSVAIAHQNRILFRQTWGLATPRENLTPAHLFRIASVTKPLTAVAIFQLIESGDLKLTDAVFGPDGVLGDQFGRNYPPVVNKITIRHLLTHTCGGWGNDAHDPMFQNPFWNHRELIAYTLGNQPLEYAPGTHYAYSNFGYCILGRVIEALSRQSYEKYVRANVLAACGVEDMRISGNTLAERVPGEVMYFGQNGENPYSMNIHRMDSHGGWLGTPSDLVRFVLGLNGFAPTSHLLSPQSLKQMTTPSAANSGYACGWSVNSASSWWHDGSLPGTSTLMVRTASGLCWAAFVNTRAKNIGSSLDQMMWQMAKSVPSWDA